MICKNCGCEVSDDAKFCTQCGFQFVQDQESTEEVLQESRKEIRAYLTSENIQRFAPLAVFLPVVERIVMGGVFANLHYLPVVGDLLYFVLKFIFVLGAGACAYGLAQLVLKSEEKENPMVWLAPGAVVVATLVCLVRLFARRIPFVFMGGFTFWSLLELACFVLGLDFLARFTINQQALSSPIDVEADYVTYRTFWQEYKANNPTTVELEKSGYVDPENSYFDGSGFELLGLLLLTVIVSGVTCGIAAPWMICKVYKWRLSHTVINGRRLTFTGTGSSLLGKWIIWEILSIITCGIYVFFTVVALYKWEARHTFIEDEEILPGNMASDFDGNSLQYFGYSILWIFMNLMTLGLAFPWVMTMKQDWHTKHLIYSGRRLEYSGTGIGFLGEFLIILVLSVVTCGLYLPFGIVRMNKYITRHMDFC